MSHGTELMAIKIKINNVSLKSPVKVNSSLIAKVVFECDNEKDMLAAIRWGIAQSSDILNHALVC